MMKMAFSVLVLIVHLLLYAELFIQEVTHFLFGLCAHLTDTNRSRSVRTSKVPWF